MHVLTIRQPWLWSILHAGKRVENRTWQTRLRGRVLLHAASRLAEADSVEAWRCLCRRLGIIQPDLDSLPLGQILGSALIVDCTHLRDPWALPGHWQFVLADVRLLAPVAIPGRLGFWRLPETWGLVETSTPALKLA